jgi:excisionase family DNA binding protein
MLESFDLLTLAEVAELLHVSKAHISKVVAGQINGCPAMPALRLGRRTLIRRLSLEAWIAENDRVGTNFNRKPPEKEASKIAAPERERKRA